LGSAKRGSIVRERERRTEKERALERERDSAEMREKRTVKY
jgi:hypothetical protein